MPDTAATVAASSDDEEEDLDEGILADNFTIRPSATDSKGNSIEYPNTWQLTKGNPEENWQVILIYLEERYGNQKNKTIKVSPYAEDISNLSYLFKKFPDRLAAKIWIDKFKSSSVVKTRVAKPTAAGNSTAVGNNGTGDGIFSDESFSSGLDMNDHNQSSQSIDDLSAAAILRLAKANKLSPDDFVNIKSKYQQEEDNEEKLILIKLIQLSGKKNNFNMLWTIYREIMIIPLIRFLSLVKLAVITAKNNWNLKN